MSLYCQRSESYAAGYALTSRAPKAPLLFPKVTTTSSTTKTTTHTTATYVAVYSLELTRHLSFLLVLKLVQIFSYLEGSNSRHIYAVCYEKSR